MTTRLDVEADLCLRVDLGGDSVVLGHLTGTGRDLQLRVDHPEMFAGRADAPTLRKAARALAGIGLRLHVCTLEGVALVSLGAVSPSWWHRRATRSVHMRVGSLRGGLTAVRGRSRRRTPLLPDSELGAPATPWPPFPTFERRPRRDLTTTHQRGGSPRLVVAASPRGPGSGQLDRQHWLTDTVTTIGSDPGCDVVLPGLSPRHAEVRHTEHDEFVVVASAPVRVHGRAVSEQLLRTSARVELGGWTLVYARDEHADHGRPFAGRVGGELGRQRRQPPQRAAG